MQPNRRVVVEINGMAPAPAAKPAAKPEAKPDAKPEAKPAAKPEAKPEAKPQLVPVEFKEMAQGNSAFDSGSAVLKAGGMEELDSLIAAVKKRGATPGSVIVTGHGDSMEAESKKNLSEERAKAVVAYLVSKGIDEKVIFWEGREAREPVPVTKFCN